MKSPFHLFFVVSVALILIISSGAAPKYNPDFHVKDKAPRWFLLELETVLNPEANDQKPPSMSCVQVLPEIIKWGGPWAEISVRVWDDSGIEMVYAEVGDRFIPMVNLKGDGKYVGHCSPNLSPGDFPITVVTVDWAGNAVRDQSLTLKVLDPCDVNCNGIEDSLENLDLKDLRVIVLHDDGTTLNQQSLDQVGFLKNEFKVLPGSSMEVSAENLGALARIKGVKGVYEDQKLSILGDLDGESSTGVGYCLRDDPRMQVSNLTGDGVTVAILDTGVDPKHLSLDDMDDDISTFDPKIVAFKDFVNERKEPYDDQGHGTHCANLIAGTGEDGGVAPGARLVAIKIMDEYGACYLSDAITALDWCIENQDDFGIDVVSFSVGGEGSSDGTSLLDKACDRIVDEGLVVCVAAGNSGPSKKSIVTPGTAENVITAGAIYSDGEIFQMSSRGPTQDNRIKPDLVTVGVDVVSAKSGTLFGQSAMSGTSMATPQVAGAVAILLEKDPSLTSQDVKRLLLKSAEDIGILGPDNVYGWGALDIPRAISIMDETDVAVKPSVVDLGLSKPVAKAGDPVTIEAEVSGEVDRVEVHVLGERRDMFILMHDFDLNGVYTARWETRFWDPGDYTITVEAVDPFGVVGVASAPFFLV